MTFQAFQALFETAAVHKKLLVVHVHDHVGLHGADLEHQLEIIPHNSVSIYVVYQFGL
jgi:hypothetical protein